MKIPKSFQLFGTTINVIFDDEKCTDKSLYGESIYSSKKIMLCDNLGIKKLSEDTIMDTFYHEKIHMILDSMSEHELSSNEKFVDIFAKLLRQSDVTAVL